ncbi:MAG TPA: ring-cleaving dioxygenase [Bryobacteraceae bacterium]|nr:ring-cleaving dioxygenase [Bryobacteraceae bacterium]
MTEQATPPPTISGIHHVTAIASDPQANLDFYVGFLGLRLVKRTVNFDDPGTYHFYYGDQIGRPGTILTFFPWPGASRGRPGTGQVSTTSFAIAKGSSEYWRQKAAALSIPLVSDGERFGSRVLGLSDPDGLALELVETDTNTADETEISGFESATLAEEGYEATARLLTDMFGFRLSVNDGSRFRYFAPGPEGNGPGATVDLLCAPDLRHGLGGAGTVHHIAWRTPDASQQLAWRSRLVEAGYNVSPVMDRNYFQSIYFREPGGILFEIATDPPGFTVDETEQELGRNLKLPPEYEALRDRIEAVLPPIHIP